MCHVVGFFEVNRKRKKPLVDCGRRKSARLSRGATNTDQENSSSDAITKDDLGVARPIVTRDSPDLPDSSGCRHFIPDGIMFVRSLGALLVMDRGSRAIHRINMKQGNCSFFSYDLDYYICFSVAQDSRLQHVNWSRATSAHPIASLHLARGQ